jgi:hypothetical protein
MANQTVTIVVTDEDMATLEVLAKKGHSYASTVARFLLAGAIDEQRKGLEPDVVV